MLAQSRVATDLKFVKKCTILLMTFLYVLLYVFPVFFLWACVNLALVHVEIALIDHGISERL